MYLYKCWCETRVLILLGVAAVAAACLFIILHQQAIRENASEPITYAALIWKAVYDSFGCDLFLIVAMSLGSGGLLQERSTGESGFTLALPVHRRRILISRALVGFCGVLAMAIAPAIIVPLASRFVGQHYAVAQALGFSLLWACCGSIFYAYTFLLSHLLEGEYSAFLVAVPSLMAYRFLMVIPWLARFPTLNVFSMISGEDTPFFNESTHRLIGPMPWLALLVMLGVSSCFVFLAVRRMESLDF